MEDYSKLKVVELKVGALCYCSVTFADPLHRTQELLKAASLPVSGKKDDLISRLQEHNQATAEATEEPTEEPVAAAAAEDEPAEVAVEEPAEAVADAAPVEAAPEAAAAHSRTPVAVEASNGLVHARDEAEYAQPSPKRVRVDEPDVEMAQEQPAAVNEVQEAVVEQPVEEEEPPEYHFEPEEEDLNRPTDMYLDTVRSG